MRTFVFIFLLAAGIGCGDKNSVPSGVLAKGEMQNLLWDMILADQYSGFLAKDSTHTDIKMENLQLYDEVFRLHHISREEFSRSYKYYLTRPDLTQALLDSIAAMGSRLRALNYSRPATTIAPPPSAKPVPAAPGQKIDTGRKRPLGLPVTPMRPPSKHSDTAAREKRAES